MLLTTSAEAIYPNFNLQTNSISDLAAIGTRTTVIEEIAIFAVGLSWLSGTYYLFRRAEKRRTMVLWMLPAVGFLMAGGSPENVNLLIHSAGAPLAFLVGAIVAILSYRRIDTRFRYFAAALGSISLVSTFVIFLGQQIVGPCGTCVGQTGYIQKLNELVLGLGGWESMIIYPLLIWLIGFGNYLIGSGYVGDAFR